MPGASDNDESPTRTLITSGANVAGTVAGTATAILAGPIAGAVVGAGLSPLFDRAGQELLNRGLARREGSRTSEAFAAAYVQVGERLEAGDTLRQDGFFESDGPALEILEGTLVTAARAWEARKAAPTGTFFGNLGFDAGTTAAEANFLLKIIDQLTYRQVLLLAVVGLVDRRPELRQRVVSMEAGIHEAWDPTSYLELDGVSAMALVGIRQQSGDPIPPSQAWGGGAWQPATLVSAALMPLGSKLYELMELGDLPARDLELTRAALGIPS